MSGQDPLDIDDVKRDIRSIWDVDFNNIQQVISAYDWYGSYDIDDFQSDVSHLIMINWEAKRTGKDVSSKFASPLSQGLSIENRLTGEIDFYRQPYDSLINSTAIMLLEQYRLNGRMVHEQILAQEMASRALTSTGVGGPLGDGYAVDDSPRLLRSIKHDWWFIRITTKGDVEITDVGETAIEMTKTALYLAQYVLTEAVVGHAMAEFANKVMVATPGATLEAAGLMYRLRPTYASLAEVKFHAARLGTFAVDNAVAIRFYVIRVGPYLVSSTIPSYLEVFANAPRSVKNAIVTVTDTVAKAGEYGRFMGAVIRLHSRELEWMPFIRSLLLVTNQLVNDHGVKWTKLSDVDYVVNNNDEMARRLVDIIVNAKDLNEIYPYIEEWSRANIARFRQRPMQYPNMLPGQDPPDDLPPPPPPGDGGDDGGDDGQGARARYPPFHQRFDRRLQEQYDLLDPSKESITSVLYAIDWLREEDRDSIDNIRMDARDRAELYREQMDIADDIHRYVANGDVRGLMGTYRRIASTDNWFKDYADRWQHQERIGQRLSSVIGTFIEQQSAKEFMAAPGIYEYDANGILLPPSNYNVGTIERGVRFERIESKTEAPTTDAPTTETPTTEAPTEKPTEKSTAAPTDKPTEKSTSAPTDKPTDKPTTAPTDSPTDTPTQPEPVPPPFRVPPEQLWPMSNDMVDDIADNYEKSKSALVNLRPFLASAGSDMLADQESYESDKLKEANLLMGQFKPVNWPNGNLSNPFWVSNMARDGILQMDEMDQTPKYYMGSSLTAPDARYGTARDRMPKTRPTISRSSYIFK